MREPLPTRTGQPSFFSSALQQTHSLLTPKRVGYTLAGAFAFVGTAAALNLANSSGEVSPTSPPGQHLSIPEVPSPQSPANNQPGKSASTFSQDNQSSNQSGGSASNDNKSSVNVTVNGKDLAVPQNGTINRSITSADGSHTSVNITSHSSGSGSAGNQATTNFSLDVNSQSTATGGSGSSE